MFEQKPKQLNADEQKFLSEIYNFILDPELTDRERKIGTLAKKDIKKGNNISDIANRLTVSFQHEASKNGLTKDAFAFDKAIQNLTVKFAPIGTTTTIGYLD